MTDKRNLMEDAEDEGLKAVMGSKFQDVSQEIPKKPAAPLNDRPARKVKQEQKAPAEPESIPTYAPNWMSKLKGCGRYAMVCGGLVALFGYWHITGQMDASAAVPCMVACAGYGGFRIGNVCRR